MVTVIKSRTVTAQRRLRTRDTRLSRGIRGQKRDARDSRGHPGLRGRLARGPWHRGSGAGQAGQAGQAGRPLPSLTLLQTRSPSEVKLCGTNGWEGRLARAPRATQPRPRAGPPSPVSRRRVRQPRRAAGGYPLAQLFPVHGKRCRGDQGGTRGWASNSGSAVGATWALPDALRTWAWRLDPSPQLPG